MRERAQKQIALDSHARQLNVEHYVKELQVAREYLRALRRKSTSKGGILLIKKKYVEEEAQ